MQITEPVIVPDVFAEGLGCIQVMPGGFARLTFYVDRQNGYGTEHRAAVKVIIPMAIAVDIARQLMQATEWARESAVHRLLHETH